MGHSTTGLHPHITHPRLQPLGEDLWTVRAPLRMGFLELGTRMTVARLPDGSLWLHSPVAPTTDLRRELDALGPVRHIVAPSKMHNLFAGPFAEAYPQARVYLAPGLREKVRALPCDEVLGDSAPAAWGEVFAQRVYDAAPMMNEVVFCHRPSRTLILTDLCFNVRRSPGLVTRCFHGVWGTWQRFGPSRAERFITKDRARARRTLDAVLGWDFERVSVCHGEVLETGGREAMRRAFADWLPASSPRAAVEHAR